MSGPFERFVAQAAEALDPDVYDEADPHYASQTYRFRREVACKRVGRVLAAVGPLIQEDTRDRMVTAAAASLDRDGGSAEEDILTIRIPRADWAQIVSDIENMCGCGRDQIEIPQSAQVIEEPARD